MLVSPIPERIIMNALDPRVTHAIQEIETVYKGHNSSHAYYDEKLKVYVLVVSGADAEPFHKAVAAIHELTANAKRRGARKSK
jgi:hypothetical protein